MNEFLACVKGDRSVEIYYDEFIKLSQHAPHLTAEQTLSGFIQGLKGILADKVEALRPVSLANALIQDKSKLKSLKRKIPQGLRGRNPHL